MHTNNCEVQSNIRSRFLSCVETTWNNFRFTRFVFFPRWAMRTFSLCPTSPEDLWALAPTWTAWDNGWSNRWMDRWSWPAMGRSTSCWGKVCLGQFVDISVRFSSVFPFFLVGLYVVKWCKVNNMLFCWTKHEAMDHASILLQNHSCSRDGSTSVSSPFLSSGLFFPRPAWRSSDHGAQWYHTSVGSKRSRRSWSHRQMAVVCSQRYLVFAPSPFSHFGPSWAIRGVQADQASLWSTAHVGWNQQLQWPVAVRFLRWRKFRWVHGWVGSKCSSRSRTLGWNPDGRDSCWNQKCGKANSGGSWKSWKSWNCGASSGTSVVPWQCLQDCHGHSWLQCWWEPAFDDLCKLERFLWRHSRHVWRSLEIWRTDCGCLGGLQATSVLVGIFNQFLTWCPWMVGGALSCGNVFDVKPEVFVYIPPEGELRGGSWVVVDPAINPDVMEMYADQDSRGGILEPAGAKGKHKVSSAKRWYLQYLKTTGTCCLSSKKG